MISNDIRITEPRHKKVRLWDVLTVILLTVVILYALYSLAVGMKRSSDAMIALSEAKTARLAVIATGKKYYSLEKTFLAVNTDSGLTDDAYALVYSLYEKTGDIYVAKVDDSGYYPTLFYYRKGDYTVRYTSDGGDESLTSGSWAVYRDTFVLGKQTDASGNS